MLALTCCPVVVGGGLEFGGPSPAALPVLNQEEVPEAPVPAALLELDGKLLALDIDDIVCDGKVMECFKADVSLANVQRVKLASWGREDFCSVKGVETGQM